MDTLPSELILDIFNKICLITDKRHFLMTCKKYNLLTKEIFMKFEDNYIIKDFDKIDGNSIEKFTLELSHDGYFDLIPENYIVSSNGILIKSLSYFGNIKLLELCKLKCFDMREVYPCAALNGQLSVLQWFRRNGWISDTKAYVEIDLSGIFLAEQNELGWNSNICANASSNGHLLVLQWLHENGCDWDEKTCSNAANNGHLECLKYAHGNSCWWDDETWLDAANSGQLECLKYAHENGCWWNSYTCFEAANNGHLECLKYAHENGCEWDIDTCSGAANNGHLECLKYAHENGCEWTYETCSSAARGGHLECLKYAHENGCEWTYEICSFAANNGQLECLKYAHENGCDFYPEPEPSLSKIENIRYIIDSIGKYNNLHNIFIEMGALLTKNEPLNNLIKQKDLLKIGGNILLFSKTEHVQKVLLCYNYINEQNEIILNKIANAIK